MPAPKKIEGLEVARFGFAAAVMAYHYTFIGPLEGHTSGSPAPEWMVFGRFAVEAFFVISGYVIAASAIGRSATDFAIRRVGRLWPAMVLCSSLTVAVVFFTTGQVPNIWAWFKSLTLAPMITARGGWVDPSYWSIRIELLFYIAIAALIFFFRRLPRIDTIAAVWLVASIIATAVPVIQKITLFPYSSFFIFGLLLCSFDRASRVALYLMPPTFALAGWQVFVEFSERGLTSAPPTLISGYLVAGFIFAITAVMRVQLPAPMGWVATRLLGPATYPLYLIHQVAGYAVINVLTPLVGRWISVGVTAALMLGVAVTIALVFEPPQRRSLERHLSRLAERFIRLRHLPTKVSDEGTGQSR